MKIRYLILGISFLLVGLVHVPLEGYAASQTSIELLVLEDDEQETIQEIDKKPLEPSDSLQTGKDNFPQGRLPNTNDQTSYRLFLIGLILCLIVIIWKYKDYSKKPTK